MNLINPSDVLSVIRQYRSPDNRCTKRMIANVLHLPYANTHSNAVDRSIRDAVTELRKRGEPICSDSGRAGYFYNREYVSHTIAEYRSRATELFDTARALERGRVGSVKQLELV